MKFGDIPKTAFGEYDLVYLRNEPLYSCEALAGGSTLIIEIWVSMNSISNSRDIQVEWKYFINNILYSSSKSCQSYIKFHTMSQTTKHTLKHWRKQWWTCGNTFMVGFDSNSIEMCWLFRFKIRQAFIIAIIEDPLSMIMAQCY